MATLPAAMRKVQTLLPKVAALGGDKTILATQEVKQAVTRGLITKAQGDVLSRAISDSGNRVSTVKAKLNQYVQAFKRADKSGDGKLDRTELKAAKSAYDAWIALISRTGTSQAAKDAAFKKIVTVTATYADGHKRDVAVYGIAPLLSKLDKLQR